MTFQRPSRSITSYGFTDIATGRSRVNLYAGIASGAGVAVPAAPPLSNWGVLSNVAFYSDTISTTLQNSDYLIFDMDFNLPQSIEGQTIIQIPWSMTWAAAGHDSIAISMAHITKGGLTTDIANGVTASQSRDAAQPSSISMATLMLDVPRTKFKKGEKLRVSMRPLLTGGADNVVIAHDPMNTSWSPNGTPSNLIIQTPFEIHT